MPRTTSVQFVIHLWYRKKFSDFISTYKSYFSLWIRNWKQIKYNYVLTSISSEIEHISYFLATFGIASLFVQINLIFHRGHETGNNSNICNYVLTCVPYKGQQFLEFLSIFGTARLVLYLFLHNESYLLSKYEIGNTRYKWPLTYNKQFSKLCQYRRNIS